MRTLRTLRTHCRELFAFCRSHTFCLPMLCSLTLPALIGCEGATSPKLESPEASASSADANATAARVEAQATTASNLTDAGANLQRDQSGLIIGIDFQEIAVTDELAEQIAGLDSLVKLTIQDSSMSTVGWQHLGSIDRLQQLDLRDCPLDNEQLLTMLVGLPKLRALRLSGTSGRTTVDDAGLAGLKNCPELKALAIDGLWVTVDGIRHLTSNAALAEVYAGGTAVDDDAVELLAELPQLRKLRLSQTGVSTVGLEALSRLPIEDLDISECSGITDESMEIVGKMKSLKRLNLWRDTVSDAGVAHLAGLTNLEWLNLDNTHLADGGLPHLAGMKKLTFLHLGSTGVTDEGMSALVGLTALKDLKVTRTAVTEQGSGVVRDAIPGLAVQLKYIEGE